MAVRIGHASKDENGKAVGGTAGDQTGRELCIRNWYNGGWGFLARPKNKAAAEKIANACESGCANDKIGYDQYPCVREYNGALVVAYMRRTTSLHMSRIPKLPVYSFRDVIPILNKMLDFFGDGTK